MEETTDIASQNCLRELQIFLPNVLNAFDLYETYSSLLHYSFGPRTLQDIVNAAMRLTRHANQVKELIGTLEDYVIKELQVMMRALHIQKRCEVFNRLELALEIYKIYETHFPEAECFDLVEDFFSDVNMMFKKGEIDPDWLPKDVQAMFGHVAAFKYAEIPLSRDSSFFQVSPTVSCPFTKMFFEAYVALENNETEKYVNVVKYKFESEHHIEKDNAIKMLKKLFCDKDLVLKDSIRQSTLAILEKICVNVSADVRRSVFTEAQRWLYAGGFQPLQVVENFASRLSNAIHGIGTHNTMQSDPAAFEVLRTEVRLLVMIAPKATLHSMFGRCLANKHFTPAVLKILQGMQQACNLPYDLSQKPTVPMLLGVFDALVKQSKERLKHPEYVETICYIVGALCRQKRSVIKEKGEDGKILRSILGDVVEESIVQPLDIFNYFILPRMFAENKADGELKTVLSALKKILTSIGEKEAPLKYSTALDDNRLNTISVPQLICYIHMIMRQMEQKDEEITDICFSILKAFGNKLKEDDVVFPLQTKQYLLNLLKSDVWWFRYAITEWYAHSLGNWPKEIPGGLFHSLDDEVRHNFKELKVDFETAPVGCMLHSIFELALLDIDLADGMLMSGFGHLPIDDQLLDQMAMALCDCCIKPFFSRRITSILPFLDRLTECLDPRSPIPYALDQINDNMMRAVREMKAIQILGRATKMAIAKVYSTDSRFAVYYPQPSPNCPSNPRVVADVFLRAFCQAAVDQVNKQVELYRRYIWRRDKGGKIDKACDREGQLLEERLLTQMVVLFHDAVLFTRCETSQNHTLDVLIARLAEYVREVQGSSRKTPLDKVKIDYKKTTYVHINSQQPKDEHPPSQPPSYPNQPAPVALQHKTNTPPQRYLDPHYNHPSQRNVSGYQRPFNKHPHSQNRGDSNDGTFKRGGYRGSDASSAMKAAAHQIPNENTRTQVERRLTEPPPVINRPAPAAQNTQNQQQGRPPNQRYPSGGRFDHQHRGKGGRGRGGGNHFSHQQQRSHS